MCSSDLEADSDAALDSSNGFNLEALAHDFTALPDNYEGPPELVADSMLDFFSDGPMAGGAEANAGGAVEAVADEDGVLIEASLAPEPSLLS